jgi:hypothetical protein
MDRIDRIKKKEGRRNAAMMNKREAAFYSAFILLHFLILSILSILFESAFSFLRAAVLPVPLR